MASLPAHGTVYVAMSDSRLADGAQLILEGRVSAVSPWGDEGRPQTRYTMSVEDILKGTWELPSIIVDLPGGRGADGTLWTVAGTPSWDVDDRVLVFLSPAGSGRWTLEQFFLGGFSVVLEGDTWIATRDLSAGHRVQLPGIPAPTDGPRDFVAFSRWLRDRSVGQWRHPDYFLSHRDNGSEDSTAKGTPVKFSNLQSPTDPWPLGCGSAGGHGLRWFDFEAGGMVPWRSHFSGQPGLPSRGVDEFQQALAAWSSQPDILLQLDYEGITSAQTGLRVNDGINSILFDDPDDEIGGTWQGSGVLAIGGPWFSCAVRAHRGNFFHAILEADIVTQDGLEEFFQSLPVPDSAAEEIFGHEIGHTLGLAHSTASDSLMSPQLHNDGRGANLSADDLAALLYLYGQDDSEPAPERPRALRATLLDGPRVHLIWLDFSDNESGFRIERRRTGGAYRVVGTTAADVTEWIDDDLQTDTEYSYRIRAHNNGGPSATTNRVIVNTPVGQSPVAPSLLRAAPLSDERVRLTWQDNANNETNYVLEILFPGRDDWLRAPFLLQPDSTAVNLTGLEAGGRYGFRIFGRNTFGISATSNAAHVTTFANERPCRVDAQHLCLIQGRFEVEVEFLDPADGQMGQANVIPSTDQTGFFWFFQPGNFELVVKMIDGRDVNGNFWVFYGGTTDLEFRLHVTDTVTGRTRSYLNPVGEVCGEADTAAFPGSDELSETSAALSAPPGRTANLTFGRLAIEALDPGDLASAPAPMGTTESDDAPGTDRANPGNQKAGNLPPCVTDERTLCLLDDRLQVRVQFRDPHGNYRGGFGQAVQGTGQSGQFWFFQIENTELVVKAVDGTAENGNLWIFFGSLSDVPFELEVIDTLTGGRKVYYKEQGHLCGGADLEALTGVLSGGTP